jgi:hypothetical protein
LQRWMRRNFAAHRTAALRTGQGHVGDFRAAIGTGNQRHVGKVSEPPRMTSNLFAACY